MSVLGQAVRSYLAAYSGYSTYLPGGITPDQFTQGVSQQPYAVYQATSRTHQRLLNGAIVATTERVMLTVVAETASARHATRNWIKDAIQASPTKTTVGSQLIDWWRVEDDGQDGNEPYQDGSDESARITSIEIVGTYA